MAEQEKSKTSLGTVFGVIGAVIGAVVILSIMGSNTKPISETKPSENLISSETYYETTFVDGCTKGGGTKSECQCVYDKMQAKWTFDEIKSISTEYAKTEKLPEAMTQMANECIGT